MSTEIATRQVMVPHTGEVVALDAPAEHLAALLDEVKDVESKLRELKAEVYRELHDRMDRARCWTIDCGEFKLTGKSDAPEVTYNPDELAYVLTALVEDGTIKDTAMDAACEAVTTWKVKKAGVNALRKNPVLAELIDGCATVAPPEGRRVSVKRK